MWGKEKKGKERKRKIVFGLSGKKLNSEQDDVFEEEKNSISKKYVKKNVKKK